MVADGLPKGKTEMKKNVLFGLFAFLLAPELSHAQGLGSITGRVTDPAGASVAGAQVVATQEGKGFSRTATTDTEGLYVIPSLQPATYILTVEAKGFSTSRETDLTLLADQTLTVNIGLKLGMTTEVVTVSMTALQIDTSTSTLKQVIEQQRISELPLNGRNAAQLTLLVAGAVNSPNGGADQGATKTFPGAVTYSANGARQNSISYQLDGGNYVDEYTNVNQPFPFPDALQEFSVQTSNYSAEYGSNAGGVVNVITKSGTNSFHGDAFEFVRNPIFNAQNFFATPTTPDRVKRNQYGGTLGGPIIHDKTFFFGGYQRTAFRNLVLGSQKVVGQTDISNFLTPKSAACPTCGAPTPAATGPAGVINPAVATLLGIDPATGAALASQRRPFLTHCSSSITRTPLLQSRRKTSWRTKRMFSLHSSSMISASAIPAKSPTAALDPMPLVSQPSVCRSRSNQLPMPFKASAFKAASPSVTTPPPSSLATTTLGPTTSVGKRANTTFISAVPSSAAWST